MNYQVNLREYFNDLSNLYYNTGNPVVTEEEKDRLVSNCPQKEQAQW